MRSIFVAFIIVAAINACADDLGDLKAASVRYVASMKAALALSDEADCFETVARANEYAAAKVAYYKAARRAMPALLEIAKGQETNSGYGKELTEIFRGFGEDGDEEAAETLEAKLSLCPNSDQRDQTRLAVEHAKKTAEQFIHDKVLQRLICKTNTCRRWFQALFYGCRSATNFFTESRSAFQAEFSPCDCISRAKMSRLARKFSDAVVASPCAFCT
jgi:hypothetical protein